MQQADDASGLPHPAFILLLSGRNVVHMSLRQWPPTWSADQRKAKEGRYDTTALVTIDAFDFIFVLITSQGK